MSFSLIERVGGKKNKKQKSRVLCEFNQKKQKNFPNPCVSSLERHHVGTPSKPLSYPQMLNKKEKEGDILKDGFFFNLKQLCLLSWKLAVTLPLNVYVAEV